ncbi:unnamed protein product [Moneuplotes crassus]|uniref:Cyclic nucleotide-binding domain-containing protein n=1 Tax=Euplotes crassus TaxID=5936 RepID=A0AAD1Y984_EUPCR|nr:unnamed protein product [Moneuplotes crassus]
MSEQNFDLDTISKILRKPNSQRSYKDNEKTASVIKNLKFIKEQNLPDKNLLDLAQCLNLLEMEDGDLVFDYGTEGDLFYIILSGAVSILIPDKKSGEEARNLSIFEQTQLGQKAMLELLNFFEIAKLVSGSSFGELALLNSGDGKRKARIVCKEDCKFATVNKENYQKVLAKIQQQHKENMINFLKQIPFISHWSKNALSRLYYAVEKVDTFRSQRIIKEGDPIDYIYIIKEGEFEVVKYLGKEDEEEKSNNEEKTLIRPLLKREDAKICRAKRITTEWHNPSRVKRRIRLSQLGECKLFGDGDARFGKNASASVFTSSQKAQILKIDKDEFMKYIKSDDEAWNKFTMACISKENDYGLRIKTYLKHMKQKRIIVKNLKKENKNRSDLSPDEIDVRRSFDITVNRMNKSSTRKNYDTQRSEFIREDSQISLDRGIHNQSIQSIISKTHTEVSLSMKKQLDSYLTNSPSRQRRRIIKFNPVYQAQYVSKPTIKKDFKLHLTGSKEKSKRLKKMILPIINIKKDSLAQRNFLVPARLNKSLDQTSKRGSYLSNFRDSRLLFGSYKTRE